MQTPALFKPMNLGLGFGDDGYDFFDSLITDQSSSVFVEQPEVDYFGSAITTPIDVNIASDFPLNLPENVASVDANGDVNANGQRVISADQIANIAKNNPGNEPAAIAKVLQATAPEFTKQIKSYDDLVRAAANLFNTSKAVIQGKPIPQNIQSPYVYNPSVYRPSTATSQLSMSSTNMLLIGGVALAAFLVLRKK